MRKNTDNMKAAEKTAPRLFEFREELSRVKEIFFLDSHRVREMVLSDSSYQDAESERRLFLTHLFRMKVL